ncbi:MAG: hypothetical protein AAGB04_00010 [Pseudomonadota bacterium]
MTNAREEYIELKGRIAKIEAAMNFDAHYPSGGGVVTEASLLDRKQTAARFGISVSKFDQDRKKNSNGNREIHLDPVPNMGRKVLFHSEKVEAELERWRKRRRRE